jgi:hypothetical protein
MSEVRHFSTTCSRKPFIADRALPVLVKCRAARKRVRRQLVELDAHGQRNAVAEGERLALAERR